MTSVTDMNFIAFVGIDWADTKHDICLQSADNPKREWNQIPHRVADIEHWALTLHQRFDGPIAVALELAKGPLVSALQKYDFLVLFPINPSMLAKYREAFTPSRAKDDPTDAELALDLLVRHRDKLAPLQPQSATMRTLATWVEQRRRLVGDKTRLTNRLGYTLKQYFPQALEWFDKIDTVLFCDFITRWSTLKQVQRARRTTLERFFHDHNMHFPHVIERRIVAIKTAQPLTDDVAVIDAHQLHAQVLADQLRVTLQAIKRYDEQIAQIAPTHPDYALFSSLPGAGPHLTPRLLVAFGEQRERFQSAAELQMYAGVAPVTERSGKKHWVHWRWQCPTFLRQTLVEWAGQTIKYSFWAKSYYDQQRAKGCTHQATLRALAFKWVRIVYRCWQTRTPYNESIYLEALRRRGSPLLIPRADVSAPVS